jgi:hypothetical protein
MSDEERRVYDKTHWILDLIEYLLGQVPDPDYTVPFAGALAVELVSLELEHE